MESDGGNVFVINSLLGSYFADSKGKPLCELYPDEGSLLGSKEARFWNTFGVKIINNQKEKVAE